LTLPRLFATVPALAIALSACGEPSSRKVQKDYPLEIRSRPEPPAPPEPDPETGLVSDAFPIPQYSFLQHLRSWVPDSSEARRADPFGFDNPFAEPSEIQPDGAPGPIQQALAGLGIPFPEGTSASYDPEAGALRLVQTPESMGLVRYLVDQSLRESTGPTSVSFRFEFYEVPALLALRLEQSAAAHLDDTPEWEALQSPLGEDGIRLVNAATVQSASGQRTKQEDGETYHYPDAFESEAEDGEGEPVVHFKERLVGTMIELDPVLGTDDRTIDLNLALEFHTAPPEWVAGTDRQGDSHGGVPALASRFHLKTA